MRLFSRAANLSLRTAATVFSVLALALLSGCGPVNSPRPGTDGSENTLYTPLAGRSPKTLDPAVSYSSDETIYTYNIYEPPYQYHYLKRPYEVIPRAAESVVAPEYFDKDGKRLPGGADPALIAESRYVIPIKKGIRFAPHPCFAKDASGALLYGALSESDAKKIRSPLDLPERATRELTADDYVYGIKRLASDRLVSPAGSLLSQHIIGLAELKDAIRKSDSAQKHPAFLDLRKIPFPKRGVYAEDSHTLVIRVKGKFPQFQNWLTMTFFAPVPWEAESFYANPGFRENSVGLAWWPVGTGPYQMAAYEENRRHALVRNPEFRNETYPCEGEESDRASGLLGACGKSIPFIDRVEFTLEKEAVPLRTKFLQGYYDSPAIERSDVGQGFIVEAADSPERAKEYAEKGIQFPRTVDMTNWYLGFNMLDPVIGEGKTPEENDRHRALRQAISIAINWEEAVSIFQKDQAVPLMGPVPPGLIRQKETDINQVVYRMRPDGTPERRPISEAKELMKKAGYPNGRDAKTGRPLVLAFDYQQSASGAKALLDWYQKQFAKLGIQLEIRATDYNRFQDKMMRGTAQIFLWGWLADYPDPENFLFLLYGPNAKAATGGNGENAANYRSPRFDRLYEKMRYMDNGPEKDAVVHEMIEIVRSDAPWSFGYAPKSAAAYHAWIRNAKPSSMIRNTLPYLALDTKQRAEKIREWNKPFWEPLLLILAAVAAAGIALRRLIRKNASATAFRRENEK